MELEQPAMWVGSTSVAPVGDAPSPSVLRVTEAHVGCLIKLRVVPCRSDGDLGHGESSRPTAEVQR